MYWGYIGIVKEKEATTHYHGVYIGIVTRNTRIHYMRFI